MHSPMSMHAPGKMKRRTEGVSERTGPGRDGVVTDWQRYGSEANQRPAMTVVFMELMHDKRGCSHVTKFHCC